MQIAPYKISPIHYLFLSLSLVMIFIAATHDLGLESLSLYAAEVDKGEIWRILTANLVHFGWIHTAMNLLAFLLCCYAFFSKTSILNFLLLLLICFLFVGLGIYFFNPYYTPYAGLSGAIHGLIAAGILLTREYPRWLRWCVGILFAGKIIYENSSYFETTDLQNLIGAQVAVEAHLYGAIGGIVYAFAAKISSLIKR